MMTTEIQTKRLNPADHRLFHSYVGSKRAYIPYLKERFGKRNFVELFAGSSVLSMNLADTALLVDTDRHVTNVLSRFDEQIVPEVFTRDEFYEVRSRPDWWKHAFALSSMAYSGVFRHSKNGFNVPAKGGEKNDGKHDEKRLLPVYNSSLARWKELAPEVRNCSYADVTLDDISAVGDRPFVVLDPPYEGSKAAYNDAPGSKPKPKDFDFAAYWERAAEINEHFDVLLFDRASNLEANNHTVEAIRTMTPNGAQKSDVEGMSFLKRKTSELLIITLISALIKAIYG